MRINDKPFKIYLNDTYTSIVNRIAATMEPPTLPKYLVFTPNINLLEDFVNNENITVRDILNELKNEERFSFENIYIPETNILDKKEDVEKVFVAYNKLLSSTSDVNINMLFLAFKNFTIDVEETWRNDRSSIIKKLETEISKNKKKALKLLSELKEFGDIKEIEYTAFNLDKIQFTIYLGKTNLDLLEL